MADETRAPSGIIENTGFIGLFAAIGVALQNYVPSEWHMVLAIAAPIVGKYAQMLVAQITGDNLSEIIKPSARLIPIMFALGLGLATAPAHAQVAPDAPPAISCGGGACNFYLVSGGWSPHSKRIYVGGNAVDFVSGTFGVGIFGFAADGDILLGIDLTQTPAIVTGDH